MIHCANEYSGRPNHVSKGGTNSTNAWVIGCGKSSTCVYTINQAGLQIWMARKLIVSAAMSSSREKPKNVWIN